MLDHARMIALPYMIALQKTSNNSQRNVYMCVGSHVRVKSEKNPRFLHPFSVICSPHFVRCDAMRAVESVTGDSKTQMPMPMLRE